MSRFASVAGVLIAGCAGILLFAARPSLAAPPQAGLCRPSETQVMRCRTKDLTFALCGMKPPGGNYVVYRERAGKGAVTQFPSSEADYARELKRSSIGASGWQNRVRFRKDGLDYYVVDAMAKGGPKRDAYGWPVNGSALVVVGPGAARKFRYCRDDEMSSIGALAYDLLPEEAFDEDLR